MLFAESQPRSMTRMLRGSFIGPSVARAAARAPRVFRRRSSPTTRRSRRACAGSLRRGPSRGSCGTRYCRAIERRLRAPRPASCALRGERPRDLRGGLAPELRADELAGLPEFFEVDAGRDAE